MEHREGLDRLGSGHPNFVGHLMAGSTGRLRPVNRDERPNMGGGLLRRT